jgi:hypothetical protein
MTITITPEEFKARLPEFENIPDNLIQANIYEAEELVNEKYWKSNTAKALRLTVAHLITMKQAEQLTIEMRMTMVRGGKYFPSPSSGNEFYSTTPYGRELMELKRKIPKCGFVL